MACKLKPVVSGGSWDAPQVIDLPDKEPVILGRSPVTGIVDKKLSRQHVEVTADYSARTVQLKQIGPNSSCFCEKELAKGETITLKQGDRFHLLTGKYELAVKFSSNTNASKDSTKESVSTPSQKSSKDTSNVMCKKESVNDQSDDVIRSKTPSSSKKRTLDDNDTASSPGVSAHKKMKSDREVDGKNSTNSGTNDIEDKLAALRQRAEEDEKKRALKKTKMAASSKEPDNGVDAKDAGSGDAGSTPVAQAGKPSTEATWEEHGKLLVYKSAGVSASSKIVGFDMDGTLITTMSGKVFAQNADDWKIIFSEVPGKLKKLCAQGYKIVIFTNQLGISKGKLTVPDFKRKVGNVQKKLGVPLQAFAATAGGIYRKPGVGMWTYLQTKGNDGIQIDKKMSMYVGDAAGRPADWAPKKKKDFSCSDRLFAINLGLPFKTPEEFFLGQKQAKFNMPVFDPRSISTSTPLLSPPGTALPATSQEVILLVGLPASGKSTFVKKHLLPHKYVHVNRDTMGTWQKCVAACSSALSKGQSVVVDNTNADLDARKRYTDCAKKAGVQCRCFVFSLTFEQARHNEKFRQLTPSGKKHDSISDMVFYSFRKNFVPPKKEEGFAEVVQVNFVPSFNNADEEKLYKTFLLEK